MHGGALEQGDILEIDGGKLTIESLLGTGGTAQVFAATYLEEPVAVKIFTGEPDDAERFFAAESATLQILENVEKVPSQIGAGHVKTNPPSKYTGHPAIVMSKPAGESLDAFSGEETILHQNDLLEVASQVANTLVEAHNKGVTHLDLKPANILWDPAGKIAKICDWATSTALTDLYTAQTGATSEYLPPAGYLNSPAEKVDVYQFGLVLHDLMKGVEARIPNYGDPASEPTEANLRRSLETKPIGCSEGLWHIVRNCLAPEPLSCPEISKVANALTLLNRQGETAETSAVGLTRILQLDNLSGLVHSQRSKGRHDVDRGETKASQKAVVAEDSHIKTVAKLNRLRTISDDDRLARATRRLATKRYREIFKSEAGNGTTDDFEVALEAAQFYLTRQHRWHFGNKRIGRSAIATFASGLDQGAGGLAARDSLSLVVLADMAFSHRWFYRRSRTASVALKACDNIVVRDDFAPETLEIARKIDLTAAARFRRGRRKRLKRSIAWYKDNIKALPRDGLPALADLDGMADAFSLIGKRRYTRRLAGQARKITETGQRNEHMADRWFSGEAVSTNYEVDNARRKAKGRPRYFVAARRSPTVMLVLRFTAAAIVPIISLFQPTSGPRIENWLSQQNPAGLDIGLDLGDQRTWISEQTGGIAGTVTGPSRTTSDIESEQEPELVIRTPTPESFATLPDRPFRPDTSASALNNNDGLPLSTSRNATTDVTNTAAP